MDWDNRYAGSEYRYGTEPVEFLRKAVGDMSPGRALCIGAGEGRNAVWLAGHGWQVTALDLSAVGLNKAERLAAMRNVSIRTVVGDAAAWDMGEARWDLITLFFIHGNPEQRSLIHRRAAGALAPAGRLILEGFTPRQFGRDTGGPGTSKNGKAPPAAKILPVFIEPGELPRQFPGLKIQLLEETEIRLTGGTHHDGGLGAVVHCIAVKPDSTES